jgi:transcriptional regulator with XRE-family HTH domain
MSDKLTVGKFIKLFRVLRGMQQKDLAEYLEIDQATLAQLENDRYRVMLYTIATTEQSSRLLNQVDDAVRNMLPSLLEMLNIEEIFPWTTGHFNEWSNKLRASLFMFYSSINEQIVVIRVKESAKDQFFTALNYVCKKLHKDYNIDDVEDISFGTFERFFSEEIPRFGDDEGKFFAEILSWTDIPNQQLYVEEYLKLKYDNNQYYVDLKDSAAEVQEIKEEISQSMDLILNLMEKNRFAIKDIEKAFKKRRLKQGGT